MAIYAVGDLQGCLEPLQRLLDKVAFDSTQDCLWLTGDLVNRGPDSLAVLRFVQALGDSAIAVLGNHDLHLLAVACGQRQMRDDDTLKKILKAKDREQLLDWLRRLPLMHVDKQQRCIMTHAGVYPGWSRKQAQALADEVSVHLQGDDYSTLLAKMYGHKPTRWDDELTGMRRLRLIISAFTRMRFVHGDGNLDLQFKGRPGQQPGDLLPWYRHPARRSKKWRLVFGHWSALGYHQSDNVIGLDTGCVWGGQLTAYRIDTPEGGQFWQVPGHRA